MSESTAPPSAAVNASAEDQAAAFAADPRIYLSKTTNRWSYEDDDGNEFEYDAGTAKWVQVVCSAFHNNIK